MWQLPLGSRLFDRLPLALSQPGAPTFPDLEMGAMPSTHYAASSPAASYRTPGGDDSGNASPQLLPTRSLVDNTRRPATPSLIVPSFGARPLTTMLEGDIARVRRQAATDAASASAYRARAKQVVRLLQGADAAASHPNLTPLRHALDDAQRAGMPPVYHFVTPTCVFGAHGLGILAPPRAGPYDAYMPNLERLALGLGCIDDTVSFVAHLHAQLSALAQSAALAEGTHDAIEALTPLPPGDVVMPMTLPTIARAAWPEHVHLAALFGLAVGCVTLTPRLGLAAGLGAIGYDVAQHATCVMQTVTGAWCDLVVFARRDDDEGYVSMTSSNASSQRTLLSESQVASMTTGEAPLLHVDAVLR